MKMVGTSVALFGGVIFLSGLILIPITDALSIDLIALGLLFLGLRLRSGRRTSVILPMCLSGWYCFGSLVTIVLLLASPETVFFGKYALTERWLVISGTCVSVVIFLWSTLNIVMLVKAKQAHSSF